MSKSGVLQNFLKSIAVHDFPGFRRVLDGFNFYDRQRVKHLGPDRVAAEWIVRCEGKVKFANLTPEFENYNILIQTTAVFVASGKTDALQLQKIDATDASITGHGCLHFAGLKHLNEVKFVRCESLSDFGLELLDEFVGKNMLSLCVDSCPRISDKGLSRIAKFKKLKYLFLNNLPYVENKHALAKLLKKSLPNCEFHFPEIEESKS